MNFVGYVLESLFPLIIDLFSFISIKAEECVS